MLVIWAVCELHGPKKTYKGYITLDQLRNSEDYCINFLLCELKD